MRDEMIAIEFQTDIKDGTIEIPLQYRDQLAGSVRVIILSPLMQRSSKIIHRLLEHPLEDDAFTPLKRDEIHRGDTSL